MEMSPWECEEWLKYAVWGEEATARLGSWRRSSSSRLPPSIVVGTSLLADKRAQAGSPWILLGGGGVYVRCVYVRA